MVRLEFLATALHYCVGRLVYIVYHIFKMKLLSVKMQRILLLQRTDVAVGGGSSRHFVWQQEMRLQVYI